MYRIGFYETETGRSPVVDFLNEMSSKARAKFAQIAIYLEDGIFEVRVIVGKDSSRVLYFFLEEKRIVFTNGFKKKTQKAPKREIETAIRYRADYIKRVKK